jgi:hypothetical protein
LCGRFSDEEIVMEKREEESQNPPTVIGEPVPPSTFGELIEWHKNNGTLREFLADYGRER